MNISDDGLQLIRDAEGLRLTAYFCPAGILTIGYGTTGNVQPGQTITKAEAEAMLRADVQKFERVVRDAVQVPVTQGQYDSLVSFCYNVGAKAFRNSTLLRQLNQSRYSDAAAQFSRWNKGGGKVLTGLVKRRAAERALFEGKA